MALVDVTGSALLSGKVTALTAPKLAAQQELAEALLGLSEAFVGRLTAVQLSRVKMAVTLQLNFQVEQGLDPFVVQSQSSTGQGESVTFRDSTTHPQAKAIVEAIELVDEESTALVQAFAAVDGVRSVRTAGSGGVPTRPRYPRGMAE